MEKVTKTFKCKSCAKEAPCLFTAFDATSISKPVSCPFNDNENLKRTWTNASTSEIFEALGMQSFPAEPAASGTRLALNAFAPDCLSAVVAALRPYAEQSQLETVVTMTAAKCRLEINIQVV